MHSALIQNLKTKPYGHQLEEFVDHGIDEIRALFWEMGLGKTKSAIDSACAFYTLKEINALVVVAPNIVHSNWTLREMGIHCWVSWRGFTWTGSKAKTKKFAKAFDRFLNTQDALIIIAFNYEAFRSEVAQDYMMALLKSRTCMLVCDESSRLKNPDSNQSKKMLRYSRYADVKRIMTGTPYTTGPFDIWGQVRVLGPDLLGPKTYTEFRTRYGLFTKEWVTVTTKRGVIEKPYLKLEQYRNIPDLKARVEPFSSRKTKEECLDLPPKVYVHHELDMSSKQELLYRTLEAELYLMLEHEGRLEELITPNVLSLFVRLQQIAGGYVLHGENLIEINKKNERLDLAVELVNDIVDSGNQVVIWSRYQHEIDAIIDGVVKSGRLDYTELHGRVKTQDKEAAIDDFQSGRCKILVGNQAAGIGITLNKGSYMIYYSNSFSLDHRLQSEDRIHRIGQVNKCTYIDISMRNTIDGYIRTRLLENYDIATQLTGDVLKKWIS